MARMRVRRRQRLRMRERGKGRSEMLNLTGGHSSFTYGSLCTFTSPPSCFWDMAAGHMKWRYDRMCTKHAYY
jgi:hypothetical protein